MARWQWRRATDADRAERARIVAEIAAHMGIDRIHDQRAGLTSWGRGAGVQRAAPHPEHRDPSDVVAERVELGSARRGRRAVDTGSDGPGV